jgi:hypothetical protein
MDAATTMRAASALPLPRTRLIWTRARARDGPDPAARRRGSVADADRAGRLWQNRLALTATGPLVFRKAFGVMAGRVAVGVALAAVAAPLLLLLSGRLPGTFPVMVLLGPLLVGQDA